METISPSSMGRRWGGPHNDFNNTSLVYLDMIGIFGFWFFCYSISIFWTITSISLSSAIIIIKLLLNLLKSKFLSKQIASECFLVYWRGWGIV